MFRPQANYGFFLGIAGVDLFFVISGFVILKSIENKPNGMRFLISRSIRIYPIYWIVATFTFSYYYILNYFNSPVPYVEIPFYHYIANLSMIQYYFNVPNIDGSYWTLLIELLFYILMYVLFKLKLINKIVKVGLIILTVTAIHFALVSFNIIADYSQWIPLLYHFPAFFIGILFYKIFNQKEQLIKLLPYIIYSICIQSMLHGYGRSTQFMSLEWYIFMLVIISFIFIFFVLGKLSFIVNPITKFLGKISYSFYLLHQPLSYGFLIPLCVEELQFNFWISIMLIVFPLCIILAGLFTIFIENPILAFLQKHSN